MLTQRTALVEGLDLYTPDPYLHVTEGTALSYRTADGDVLVVVRSTANASTTLRSERYSRARFIDLRGGKKGDWTAGSTVVTVGDDGLAWLMMFDSLPEISAYDWVPEPLITGSPGVLLKAAVPVIDIHVHPGAGTRAGRELVHNEVGVSEAIYSGFAERGDHTADLAGKGQAIMAVVDLSACTSHAAVTEVCEILEHDAKTFPVVGIGEVHEKGDGVATWDNGDRIFIGDTRLDPLWETATRLELPVLLHAGESAGTEIPLGPSHPGLRRAAHSPWFSRRARKLSAAEVRLSRNDVLQRHPDLVVIAAHMDNQPGNLDALAAQLDHYDNLYVELGRRHLELGLQPRLAARFCTTWSDRILFGGDHEQTTDEYREQFRVLETEDDCFLPGDRLEPWALYGLGLDKTTLTHIYRDNAVAAMPKLPALLADHLGPER